MYKLLQRNKLRDSWFESAPSFSKEIKAVSTYIIVLTLKKQWTHWFLAAVDLKKKQKTVCF